MLEYEGIESQMVKGVNVCGGGLLSGDTVRFVERKQPGKGQECKEK